MTTRASAELTAIYRYPVKSCRGQSLQRAVVEPWGLAGDRRWMLVDRTGTCITAREHPLLLLTRPELVERGLRLWHPDAGELDVHVPRDGESIEVDVHHGQRIRAALADDRAHAWFSALLGVDARLVHLDDPTQRATNPDRTRSTDRVSFADGYPMLLASEESLAALNAHIAAGRYPHEAPVPMTRFRPSLVVSGAPAWAEDRWRRVRIGPAEFRVVKGCDRCVMTLVDTDTARLHSEPMASLARYRRWDGMSWFAVNLVPDSPGARIAVGDDVVVFERAAVDGPLR